MKTRYRMRWTAEEWRRLRELVCRGLKNPEIAAEMGRPYGTIAVYISILGGRHRIQWDGV